MAKSQFSEAPLDNDVSGQFQATAAGRFRGQADDLLDMLRD